MVERERQEGGLFFPSGGDRREKKVEARAGGGGSLAITLGKETRGGSVRGKEIFSLPLWGESG